MEVVDAIFLVVVIILIILLASIVLDELIDTRLTRGGSGICDVNSQLRVDEKIPADAIIIVDGMNFIYHLALHTLGNAYVNADNYFPLIDKASFIIGRTFPGCEIHFIVKNLDVHKLENHTFNKAMFKLSRTYPITYHLAFGADVVGGPHIANGRDDFLVMLQYNLNEKRKPTYILSLDEFVDDRLYPMIAPFIEALYSENKRITIPINPSFVAPSLVQPIHDIYTLYRYEFVNDDKLDGTVYIHKNYSTKCANILL